MMKLTNFPRGTIGVGPSGVLGGAQRNTSQSGRRGLIGTNFASRGQSGRSVGGTMTTKRVSARGKALLDAPVCDRKPGIVLQLPQQAAKQAPLSEGGGVETLAITRANDVEFQKIAPSRCSTALLVGPGSVGVWLMFQRSWNHMIDSAQET